MEQLLRCSSVGVCGWQKMTFSSVFGSVLQKAAVFGLISLLRFWFFWFVFCTVRRCHLSFTPLCYDARNDILLCWIGPTNCHPNWLRTRSAELRHEEKYFDCWSYHVGRWVVNETTWKIVPKPPKSVLKTELWKLSFEVNSVQFGF